MTREEAIKKLQKQKAEYLDEWVDFSGVAEAYDMAIEALTNQQKWIDEELQNYVIEHADLVTCKDCRFKELYDDGDTKYYYCALEDRPNRQWSVDDTDFCSWAERKEP